VSSSEAEASAGQLLDQLGITDVPVPVAQIAVAAGASVTYDTFDGQVSGLLYRDAERCVIGVNSRHAPVRQRFTIAHEIGHLRMHEGRPVFIDRLVRMNARDGTSTKEEVEANAFAAALLMPGTIVEREFDAIVQRQGAVGRDRLLAELAERFEVSAEAMGYRLTNLGIVDPDAGF
jgi:Zn-dependent peptidase ImmA (M78 family)